jgi:hypothetical protein
MPRLYAIAEQLHQRVHQGTCADIYPSLHESQMRGFMKRAQAILDAVEASE